METEAKGKRRVWEGAADGVGVDRGAVPCYVRLQA